MKTSTTSGPDTSADPDSDVQSASRSQTDDQTQDPAQDQPADPAELAAAAQLTDALSRIFGGETLADIESIPQEYLETLYDDSCNFVDAADFESALDPLLYLVTANPYDFRFQFGYALCLHQLGQAADAAKHYGLAYMLDPRDPGCAYRLGECHLAMGDREAAEEAFHAAIALSIPPTAISEVRAAAEAALDRLNA